jgi:uncharacterized membrane protein
MFTLYLSLKFLHVAAVIFWIGGIGGLTVMVLRAGREKNLSVLTSLMQLSVYFGQRVIGPASGVALLAGLGMVFAGHLRFMTAWILWGMTGFLLHFIIGGTILRKNGMQLARLASAATPDQAAVSAALDRQKTVALLYLLIMLSTVWAMVAKPG